MQDFYELCEKGDLDSVKKLIMTNNYNWNHGLENACISGNLDLVKLMIEKGANKLNHGLENACKNCHFDIIDLLISKGCTYEKMMNEVDTDYHRHTLCYIREGYENYLRTKM